MLNVNVFSTLNLR